MELVNQKQFLNEHPIFRMLKDDQIDRLLMEGELRLVPKHHFVIHEKQDDIFLLLKGCCKKYV